MHTDMEVGEDTKPQQFVELADFKWISAPQIDLPKP
jgi:hypothetical protein